MDPDLFPNEIFGHVYKTLMEEDIDGASAAAVDPTALRAAESSFLRVLAQDHSSPSESTANSPSINTNVATNQQLGPLEEHSSTFGSCIPQTSYYPMQMPMPNGMDPSCGQVVKPSMETTLLVDPSSDNTLLNEYVLLFKKGVEEGAKFLQEKIDKPEKGDKSNSSAVQLKRSEEATKFPHSNNNHLEEEEEEEERAREQSAFDQEEEDFTELFEKLFLCANKEKARTNNDADEHCKDVASYKGETANLQQNKILPGLQSSKSKAKKKRKSKEEVVDLRGLLMICADAIANNSLGNAYDLLRLIRQNSSPFGNASQRTAHYFVMGLEARLSGKGWQVYSTMGASDMTATTLLKAYKPFISVCPFRRAANFFANYHILSLAQKATTLHIIDFGILFGFQWPIVIQQLSTRPGGPPKLRFTGIEFPSNARGEPTTRVDQACRRITKYCRRFDVPFEYNGIARKWETIRIKDLKLNKGEAIVVNSLFRFDILNDEAVEEYSQRTAVLDLIRRIDPDIFVHGVINGSHNAPLLHRRLQEAVFYYSTIFDMLETVLADQPQARSIFENGLFGGEIVNVVACEGSERVMRPETYKNWQMRNNMAGFRQLPIEKEAMQTLRECIEDYNKNFAMSEDKNWLLLGWKGRIINAVSCWAPDQKS